MRNPQWSTPALIARIEVTTALNDHSSRMSAELAQHRLTLLNLTSDVDAGRKTSAKAEAELKVLLAQINANT